MSTELPRRLLMALGLVLPVVACSAQDSAAGIDAEQARVPPKLGLCAACHNVDGVATLPAHPHLAGQNADYMKLTVAKYRSGERSHAAMRASVSALTQDDLDRIIDYYASLSRTPTSLAP